MKGYKSAIGFVILLSASLVNAKEQKIIAWWDFDTKGNAGSVPGRFNRGLQLNGANSVSSELDGTYDSLTIALWIKADQIIYPYTSLVSTNRWSESDVHFLILQNGRIQLSIYGNEPVDVSGAPQADKFTNQWAHIAAVYDSKAKTATIYINGKLDKEITYNKALPVHLNKFFASSWNGRDRFFKGLIDELCIYDRAIPPDDIEKLMKGEKVNDGLLMKWSFDKLEGEKVGDDSGKGHIGTISGSDRDNYVFDKAGNQSDLLEGNYKYVDGVSGKALRLDGYTTSVNRQSTEPLDVNDGFSVEAWIAPQAYPWNWTGIIDREKDRKSGFSFGIDAYGRIGLQLAIDGQWHECISKEPVSLLKWSHIAASFDNSNGIKLYINGKDAGANPVRGKFNQAEQTGIYIGRSHTKMCPENTEREPSAAIKSEMIFEGLIDEIKIHNGALSTDQIKEIYAKNIPANPQPLTFPVMPSGPKNVNKFGAFYTRLEYNEAWDDLWPAGPFSDIVVTFDEVPTRVVFWRGMNYAANYITENGIWIGDQSLERGGPRGCYEHMSDKQCRYAHARIIENSDARIVVHWRYAICDIVYEITDIDNDLAWGSWADEYFTIYPDGLVVRHQVLWPDKQQRVYYWQETIFFNQPGTKPEDNVQMEAITLVNINGKQASYSWEKDWPPAFPEPNNPILCMTNLKAKYRHFLIHQPGGNFGIFWGHNALSHFTCWNHWPVAQLPNDGRQVTAFDRPSHTSLTIPTPKIVDGEKDSKEAVSLYGLTELSAKELVPLAKSWIYPADLKKEAGDFVYSGFESKERAYILDCTKSKKQDLKFTLAGSENSPIINPAFVIKGWNSRTAKLKIDGKNIQKGKDFRYGLRNTLEGSDLVIWLKLNTKKPVTFQITE